MIKDYKRKKDIFKKGDFVRLKLTGETAMVIGIEAGIMEAGRISKMPVYLIRTKDLEIRKMRKFELDPISTSSKINIPRIPGDQQ
jgi:hypothetical protein